MKDRELKKRKVLFVVTSFATGGITSSLQNFLNSANHSLIEVDVFALSFAGFYPGVLTNCKILDKDLSLDLLFSRFDETKGALKALSFVIKTADSLTKNYLKKYLFKRRGEGLIKYNKYDAIIAYREGTPTLFVSYMEHQKKISWIHCDYKSYYKLIGGKNESDIYRTMHAIVCVSEYTRDTFLEIYPEFRYKTFVIYNILNVETIVNLSKEKVIISEENSGGIFNIVSVGRLDPIKRLSVIPSVARIILDAGYKFKWYIIGPKGGTNEEYNDLINNIREFNVQDSVIYLGEKRNPFPYIIKADLLVSTSISEACPYVINEALLLKTPVVCTDFGSAKEFIINGHNGYYVVIDLIAEKICDLISNPKKIEELQNNLTGEYDNSKILNAIYSLIDNE